MTPLSYAYKEELEIHAMTDFNNKNNRFVWCDIPVDDLDRACAFYEGVMGIGCYRESFGDIQFAVLDHHDGNGGCLVPRRPGQGGSGPLVYLNVDGRIREAVQQVAALGGKVMQDVHAIGPHGCRALIEDSEGNAMALHSTVDE
ncbi:MAG: VOC family protein [Phycisphaerales bacterium JB047]